MTEIEKEIKIGIDLYGDFRIELVQDSEVLDYDFILKEDFKNYSPNKLNNLIVESIRKIVYKNLTFND